MATELEKEMEIVEKAKKDLKAFGELYDMYFKKIYTYVAYMVGNNEDAEDIVAETFEKAMLNIDRFEYRGFSFGSWLYRIARNLVYDRSKSKKTVDIEDVEEFIGIEDENPEKITIKNEMDDYLNSLVMMLSDDQKEVVILRYIKGYSIKEVCDILDKSEDSIKSLAKRALIRLKEINDKHNGR